MFTMHRFSSIQNLKAHNLKPINLSAPKNTHRLSIPSIISAGAPASSSKNQSQQNKPPRSPNQQQKQQQQQPKQSTSRIGSHKTNPSIAGPLRLNKALAAAGVTSRRGADDYIFAGRVSVNGSVVKEPGTRINLAKDKLSVDGKPISLIAASKMYYFALNKPKGHICSSQGDGQGGSGDRLVVDIFTNWLKGWKSRHPGATTPPRLFTVGRLDVQSVGLIFVTNDGEWAQSIQHPSSGLTKEYVVGLNRRPGKTEVEKLEKGCDIDGVFVSPVAVAIDDSDPAKRNRIRIVLAEGRNREVRRLVENAGMEVLSLRRVRIGGYRLPRNLKFGEFVEMRPHEVRRVLNVGADRSV